MHSVGRMWQLLVFNPLNPELNTICYLLALLGAHHFLHVSRIRVKDAVRNANSTQATSPLHKLLKARCALKENFQVLNLVVHENRSG